TCKNDHRLGVANGLRGTVTEVDLERRSLVVAFDSRERVELPASYIDEGHLDHGYALTAHRAQGATVDRTLVLGSDELYREWGYTALTRHRDSAKYYVTAPEPYRNRPAVSIQDKEELVETVVRTFEDSR